MKLVGILFLLFSFHSHADELRLYLLRSPLGVNWSSPWGLTTSILKNEIAPVGNKRAYSISHVFVELNCQSTGTHIYRGMTSATTTEERELIFKKKYGLGTMFHFFAGKLEKDEGILRDLAPYAGSKRRAELTIKVSPESCQRMVDYAYEYEKLGYGKMYSGLQADPLKGEGAGCSAFAVSFLRVGGLMDDFTQHWKKILDVPKKLIGGPMTGNKVNIITLVANPFARWSNKVPHVHLEAWDPESMHSWIKKTYQSVKDGKYDGKWPIEISREKKTLKIELDMSNRETPSGPFWI